MNPNQGYTMRSVSQLVRLGLNVPEWQRLASDTHVSAMRDAWLAHWNTAHEMPVIPGCLILCHRPPNGYTLIDGQHRFLALKQLLDHHQLDWMVMCCDITVQDEDGMYHWFETVNKTLPLKLPPRQQRLTVPNQAVRLLRNKYPRMFSEAERPRRPHLNAQVLASRIAACSHVAGLDANRIVECLECYSQHMKTLPLDCFCDYHTKFDTVQRLVQQIRQKGILWLGLYKDYEFVKYCWNSSMYPNASGSNTLEPVSKPRSTIPKRVRTEVWTNHAGNSLTGPCYACNVPIRMDSFHAGHVTAVCNGGATTVSNLRPVCAACNLSCGTHNLDTFKQMLR